MQQAVHVTWAIVTCLTAEPRKQAQAQGLKERVHQLYCGLQWQPQRQRAIFAATFISFAGRGESRTIRKPQMLGILVIPSLVFTTPSGEHISHCGPAKIPTKRRHTLLFPAGRGESHLLSRALSLYQRLVVDCWVFWRALRVPLSALELLSSHFRCLPSVQQSLRSPSGMCMMALCPSLFTCPLAWVACWLCLGKGRV